MATNRFPERDPINNVWGKDQTLSGYKQQALAAIPSIDIQQVRMEARGFLTHAEPYMVKIGVQMMRIAINLDPSAAEEWVNYYAPRLEKFDHPRVKHSSLWNVRSSVWQAPELAPQALEFAKRGLNEQDPAVQRVAIWTHGDVVQNKPDLFKPALDSIENFTDENPKESNALFALEEFYSLNRSLREDPSYKTALEILDSSNSGNPGVQARCALILGDSGRVAELTAGTDPQRLLKTVSGSKYEQAVLDGNYEKAADDAIRDYETQATFGGRMKLVWILRDILWTRPNLAPKVFAGLSGDLYDEKDGDLTRTTSVVVGDAVICATEKLARNASLTATDFFINNRDNDGSQIVVAQTLAPLRLHNQSSKVAGQYLPILDFLSFNKSVKTTVQNLLN